MTADSHSSPPALHRQALVVASVIAAVLVVLRSFVWVFFEESFFDSDQAVVGLMAKHLAEGRAFPLFFYGQHYMLGVESWMAAPLIAVAGASVATLKLPLLAINIAVAVLLLRTLVRRVGLGVVEALVASAFFIVPAPLVSLRLVEAQGGNVEPFLYVLLLWLLRDRMIAFGLVAGLGFFHREFVAYAIAGIVLVDLLTARAFTRPRLRGYAVAASMFLIVALGIRLLKARADLLGPGTAGTIDIGGLDVQLATWGQFLCGSRGQLLSNLQWLAQENLGVLFNWKEGLVGPPDWSQTPTGHPWVLLFLVAFVAVTVVQIFRGRRNIDSQGSFGVYLTIVGVEAACAYAVLGCQIKDGTLIRYTLLTLYIPIGLAVLFLASKPSRSMRILVLGLAVLVGASNLADNARLLNAYVRTPPRSPMRELVQYLESEGVRYGRGTYWIAYELDFLSQERLTISSLEKVRVAEYQRIADEHDQQTVHILPNPGWPSPGCAVGVSFQKWCLQYFDRAKHVAPVP